MILICSKCGAEIERSKNQKDPVCFECRKKSRKEYTDKRKADIKSGIIKPAIKKPIIFEKKKLVVNMVENPHESFTKFTKKLIYSFPARHNKKTIEYNDWLTRDYFARLKCCHCESKLIFLSRKDNPYSVTSCCNNKNCCLYSDYRKITTWKVIKK